ncbi:MAG: flagellar basal body-associated FliL family protein [Gammaproteobacteria bacterium]|nr:flagellar basal body-associated FliL family protein [Gammaproteobacteria bacterium]
MAEGDENSPAEPAKRSGGLGGRIVNALGIFLLTLAAVVVGGYLNAVLHPPPDFKLGADGKITPFVPAAAPGAAADAGKPAIYYALDPPLVVNFQDGEAVRFLQVSIEVMARNQKAIDSVKRNEPLIRNNLLMLMSNRDFKTLMTLQGKEDLRKQALAAIQAVQRNDGGPLIDDVLFTSFVVQ